MIFQSVGLQLARIIAEARYRGLNARSEHN
jgi:hypothetical protein